MIPQHRVRPAALESAVAEIKSSLHRMADELTANKEALNNQPGAGLHGSESRSPEPVPATAPTPPGSPGPATASIPAAEAGQPPLSETQAGSAQRPPGASGDDHAAAHSAGTAPLAPAAAPPAGPGLGALAAGSAVGGGPGHERGWPHFQSEVGQRASFAAGQDTAVRMEFQALAMAFAAQQSALLDGLRSVSQAIRQHTQHIQSISHEVECLYSIVRDMRNQQ